MRFDQHLPARWASGFVITTVLGLTAAAQTPSPTPTPAAAPPSSDIFLIDVKTKKGELVFGDPQRITNTPGYNNQPSFMPDGKSVLYTSIREKQADIYRYELGTGATSQVTDTPESEYSATLMPDKKNISVVRVEADGTQRLWKFSLDGGSPVLILENVKPVGYHHWIDDHTLALFILGVPGKPNFLEVLDAATGKSEFVTENPGRILRKVPNQNKFSFVHKVSDKIWEIKAFDLRARTSASLVATLPGAEDYAWLPDGKLLLAKDSKLFAVLPLSGSQWEEVADFSKAGIKRVTRIAVNSSGSRIAIVGVLDKK
ncbi:MAG: TolB family protein [Pyrinomonadaceae bacterium]